MGKRVQRYFEGFLLLAIALLLVSCPANQSNEFYLLAGSTRGTWEWLQTLTPTRILTPQSTGSTKQLAVGTDNNGAYVAFYRNDTLQLRRNETSTDTTHTFVDYTRQTVLIQYGKAGYLRYTFSSSSDNSMMTVSDFVSNSSSVDSVKNVYRRTNLVLYPY